ncbi:hypothetical protein F2Q70_00018523 [Brassica cretica]|uniref:Uncharacterized protein n=1 Tax=Brassica cretica TaxID=69181 RepID=A0A8S9HSG8_BRACR|nr:hypothetical protein F2Q70_00018523 [Brassica cretica]
MSSQTSKEKDKEVQEAEHDPQVCIDFTLVCRVSMFAADCATYGGVWGGQGGSLGLIVNFFDHKVANMVELLKGWAQI